MICLRSQLPTKKSVSPKDVFIALQNWGKSRTDTNTEVFRWLSETDFDSIPKGTTKKRIDADSAEIFKKNGLLAVRLSEKRKNYTTTICFNAEKDGDTISVEAEKQNPLLSYEKPAIFDFLEPLLTDYISRKSILEGNQHKMARLITGEENHALPLVYISAYKGENYPMDADFIAQKLFGIARVYKEPNASYSKYLKSLSGGKNTFNGVCGLYCNGFLVRFVLPEDAKNCDFFPYISYNAIRISLDDALTWSGITDPEPLVIQQPAEKSKIEPEEFPLQKEISQKESDSNEHAKKSDEQSLLQTNLLSAQREIERLLSENAQKDEKIASLELEVRRRDAQLEAKKRELSEYARTFDTEIEELRTERDELKKTRDTKKKSDFLSGAITVHIRCKEKSLFDTEIEDFIKGMIFRVARNYEQYKSFDGFDKSSFLRIHDVLKSIFEENADFEFEKSKSYEIYKKLVDGSPDTDSEYHELLKEAGFQELEFNSNHHKFCFFGDKRYVVTAPSTRSDKRGVENSKRQAIHALLAKQGLTLK